LTHKEHLLAQTFSRLAMDANRVPAKMEIEDEIDSSI